MRRDDEAPHTSAGGSKGRGGPVVKGTAHRTPSPDSVSGLVREIRLAGSDATISDLALAHDPRAFVISEAGFTCPLCHQRAARIRCAVVWTCGACRADSTIFELFRLALERPAVLERLRAGTES
jgi:hypothetical protein